MGSFISSVMGGLASLARILTLPVLREIGGILLTLTVPVLRALAGVFLIVAAVALASDLGTVTTGGRARIEPTSVITHWQQIAPASLEDARSFLTKRTRPWVWDAFSAPLRLPAFAVFALLGLIAGYIGRRRNRVNIFSN
jgi:hypothetical protein